MNTIHPLRTALCHLRNSESWKFLPTKHSILIVKCTLSVDAIQGCSLSSRYYEGGVSSVYLWDLDDGGFAGVVLLKKSMSFLFLLLSIEVYTAMEPSTPNEPSGSWDSIHVFETTERGRQAHYKLTSTVMLQLTTRKNSEGEGAEKVDAVKGIDRWKRDGEVNLSGSMTRQTEQDWPIQDASSHITNTGKMIEEMEIKMRNLLQEVG